MLQQDASAVPFITDSDAIAIQRLLSDFAWHADRSDAQAVADLFLPNGVLRVGEFEFIGHDQIMADCRRRFDQPGRKTRHMFTNLRMDPAQNGAVSLTAVLLNLGCSSVESAVQLRASDVDDLIDRDASGRWRFARHEVRPELMLGSP